MPRFNPARREALADAAIAVLGRDGARSLTYRSVDAEAGVPLGTTSNYFASRDALLEATGRRILVRLWPAPETLREAAAVPPSRERLSELLVEAVERAIAAPALHLGLLELRLEATRNPTIAAALTATIRDDISANAAFQADAGLPGDALAITGLYLALNGLVVDRITLPDVLGDLALAPFVAGLVKRLVV